MCALVTGVQTCALPILIMFDREKIFSSEQGWGPVLNLLFPRGLMLMDFEKHRADRKILSVAFKPEPMRRYADSLNEGIRARIRSEEHTSELQSLMRISYAVFCLKKKKHNIRQLSL